MVPVGLGGDGGGSIRIPSAMCGLFGLKPQRGRVTTAPHPHLWWALGTAGPLTRTVLDSAIFYDAIRGNVPTDLYSAGEITYEDAMLHADSPNDLRLMIKLGNETDASSLDVATRGLSIEDTE